MRVVGRIAVVIAITLGSDVVLCCGEGCGGGRPPTTRANDGNDARLSPASASASLAGGGGMLGGAVDARVAPEVAGGRPTTLGTTAFTANARVQPHGWPTTVWIEYGPTTAYGKRTTPRALAPKLTAFFHESWEEGLSGFNGGIATKDLSHRPVGGVVGAHVRYRDTEGGGDDTNHLDGIGVVHLTKYFYLGSASEPGMPSVALGGGDPDLRDARITVHVRGEAWKPSGTELVWWMQCDRDLVAQNDTTWRRANWAHTGSRLTDLLASGKWERAEYRLANDSNQWTYAGNSVGQRRPNYVYWSLDEALSHVNNDAFHMLVFVDQGSEPSGIIDYDELEIAYRNHNVLAKSNGGKLTSSPPGSPDPEATLTDGWRNGPAHAWRGPPNPKEPFTLVFELEHPVVVDRVQLHAHPEFPAKEVEVESSPDGASWDPIAKGELPTKTFLLARAPRGGQPRPARFVRVKVSSGYRAEHWGLGEIEVFGTGAKMRTDDDWYNVNQDLVGLAAGATIHYRFVAESEIGKTPGADATFTVPTGAKPEASTGGVVRASRGAADVEGRVNTFGKATEWWFEYGADASYGQTTDPKPAGLQITPRTVQAAMKGLESGKLVHYRVVAKSAAGVSKGDDMTFTAR